MGYANLNSKWNHHYQICLIFQSHTPIYLHSKSYQFWTVVITINIFRNTIFFIKYFFHWIIKLWQEKITHTKLSRGLYFGFSWPVEMWLKKVPRNFWVKKLNVFLLHTLQFVLSIFLGKGKRNYLYVFFFFLSHSSFLFEK